MKWIRSNTAATVKLGPFVDPFDNITPVTNLTIVQADILLSKNGGIYTTSHNTVGGTHDTKGQYGIPLDITDTNTVGSLRVLIHKTDNGPVWEDYMVIPEDVYDSLILGTGDFPITYSPKSGGGILTARIGIVSLTSQDFFEIVQGEEKVITFIVEAHGRFVQDTFDAISVKIKDSAGTVIFKEEDEYETYIQRVCQELDVQVIRCILTEEETASLVAGLMQIEIAFDTQKARLTHSLKVLDQIIDEGS